MTAANLAQSGYAAANSSARTPRSLEYEVIARITRRLRQAETEGPDGFSTLVDALQDNRRLWTLLAVDVANPDNPLPSDLKANLVYLMQFTQHHTSLVLARQEGVGPLVDINTAIMRGLKGGAD